MKQLFQKKQETSLFFTSDNEQIERKTEVRFDPLTGETSRIVFDPGMPFPKPDYTQAIKQTQGDNCPFCPENVWKQTPKFPETIAEDGRLTQGEAVVAPNLFPYSKHNGVVIMSEAHFLRLEDFTVKMIKDAFMAAQTYAINALNQDRHDMFVSINWNYLPPSGGSILHPHLQVILSESPTNDQLKIAERSQSFYDQHKEHYFEFLYKHEFNTGERWIGEHGQVSWMHAFAPKSHNDFLAIFRNRSTIHDITEKDWEYFAKGLVNIFATLTAQDLASFNLGLMFSHDGSPAHARLIPRVTLGGLDTSDINFFHTIHGEALSYKQPESIASFAREHFTN